MEITLDNVDITTLTALDTYGDMPDTERNTFLLRINDSKFNPILKPLSQSYNGPSWNDKTILGNHMYINNISNYVEEDGYTIKKELFPEAYMLQQKHLELKDLYQVLLRPYYFKRTETFNGTIKEFSSREYELMSQYGIDKNWLTDYVVIIDKPSTTVGTYQAGESISTEYYYNKLKPKMINEYKDC